MTDRDIGDADKSELALEIVRVFDAPRALVFQAWIDEKHMRQWSAPRDYAIAHNEGEVRVGSAWRSCMRSIEGGEELWLSGAYLEVVENERIVFTHAWDRDDGSRGHETVVTVTFEDQGGKTRMNFRQAYFESVDDRDGHGGGWGECFELLEELLAREVPR